MVVIIGLAQALALIPNGTSRSGITMTALLLGMQRSDAARFSFYYPSHPLILAAGGLKRGPGIKPVNVAGGLAKR